MGLGRVTFPPTPYTTLVNNGTPSNRLDIAILGDGFTESELPLFYDDCDKIVDAFHSLQPFKSYWKHLNFHRVNSISPQSGCDDRWVKPKVRVKSALGAHFSLLNERRLIGWDWRVWQVARKSGVPFDALLVVVNTPRRGGATRFWMTVGYASRNSSDFPRLMVHEAGHAIAKLADEYDYELPEFRFLQGRSFPNILPFANVDTNGRNPKWKAWTEDGTCQTCEGGTYTKFGAFRPSQNCMMEASHYDYCPVCQEQWIKRIYKKSKIIDRFLPKGKVVASIGENIQFSAKPVSPTHISDIKTDWHIRYGLGNWRLAQATPYYEPLNQRFQKKGPWSVRCTLQDHGSKIRKWDVINQSQQQHDWSITVE